MVFLALVLDLKISVKQQGKWLIRVYLKLCFRGLKEFLILKKSVRRKNTRLVKKLKTFLRVQKI